MEYPAGSWVCLWCDKVNAPLQVRWKFLSPQDQEALRRVADDLLGWVHGVSHSGEGVQPSEPRVLCGPAPAGRGEGAAEALGDGPSIRKVRSGGRGRMRVSKVPGEEGHQAHEHDVEGRVSEVLSTPS